MISFSVNIFDDMYQSKILYDPPPRVMEIETKSKKVGPD